MRSLEELNAIRDKVKDHVGLRTESGQTKDGEVRAHVLVCAGTGCTSSNSLQIADKLEEELKAGGLDKEIHVVRTGCHGLCALGPIMIVYPEAVFYSMVTVDEIGRAHV